MGGKGGGCKEIRERTGEMKQTTIGGGEMGKNGKLEGRRWKGIEWEGLRGEGMEEEVDFSQFISRYLVVREPH